MTTIAAERQLDWDQFLLVGTEEVTLRAIEVFRGLHWPNMKRELETAHGQNIAEGVEPHWTAPAEAMFWQQTTLRKRIDGHTRDILSAWEPVGPLSAGSTSVIARYLENGMRFRPPNHGVDGQNAAVPSDGFQDAAVTYRCRVHETVYPTWKGYLQHCRHKDEMPLLDLPADRESLLDHYKWYCRWWDIGWDEIKLRGALQHQRTHRVGVLQVHATLESMENDKQELLKE